MMYAPLASGGSARGSCCVCVHWGGGDEMFLINIATIGLYI